MTINTTFMLFNLQSYYALFSNWNRFAVVLYFEVGLRLLTRLNQKKEGGTRFPLLNPIYYFMITPIFYLGLWIAGMSVSAAKTEGYFFPAPTVSCASSSAPCPHPTFAQSVFNQSLFDIWRVVQFSKISWIAVAKSIPTIIALAAFSLIHVPINIPAIAISMDLGEQTATEEFPNADSHLVEKIPT